MEAGQEFIRRTAVVTGGSRGIGRAICVKLAAMGMDVCINYAGSQAAATETLELCRQVNPDGQMLLVQADVSTEDGAKQLIGSGMEAFGRIDVLVNNAGITRDKLILKMTAADFDQVLNTNLRGAFLCCQAVSKIMLKQRYGRIINTSSIVGLRGNVGQANYAASKAGLIGLTKSLAKELASRNITVNAIAPGFIATDMTAAMPEAARTAMLGTIPMGRGGAPEEVAAAVAFFAAEESAYITGQVLCVDGGMAV